jgi:sRNA-binding carbon storage regulator CsrA
MTLILTRKVNEAVKVIYKGCQHCGEQELTCTYYGLSKFGEKDSQQVKLGFEAPLDFKILREELITPKIEEDDIKKQQEVNFLRKLKQGI